MNTILQPLPSHPEAEKTLLAGWLLNPEAAAALRVQPDWFHVRLHREVWTWLGALVRQRGAPELPQLIAEAALCTPVAEILGDVPHAWLAELYGWVSGSTASDLRHASDLVEAAWRRRQGLKLAEAARAAFLEIGEPWEPALDDIEAQLLALRQIRESAQVTPAAAVLDDVLATQERRVRAKGQIDGLKIGFPQLDVMFNGIQPEEFVVIGARPAMGKTAFAGTLAEHVALRAVNDANVPCLFFSLEMSSAAILQRLALGAAEIDLGKGRTGMHSEEHTAFFLGARADLAKCPPGTTAADMAEYLAFCAMDRLTTHLAKKGRAPGRDYQGQPYDHAGSLSRLAETVAAIRSGNLSFYNGYGVNTQEIRAAIRRWLRSLGWAKGQNTTPPVVLLDYVQLIQAAEKKNQREPRLAIVEACQTLKGIAKEYGIIIFGLAQVGRNKDASARVSPKLSELKEAGAIEEYADSVLFLHRPSYYSRWEQQSAKSQADWDTAAAQRNQSLVARQLREPAWSGQTFYEAHAWVDIAKGRDCPTGKVDVLFLPRRARFASMTTKAFTGAGSDGRPMQLPGEDDDE